MQDILFETNIELIKFAAEYYDLKYEKHFNEPYEQVSDEIIEYLLKFNNPYLFVNLLKFNYSADITQQILNKSLAGYTKSEITQLFEPDPEIIKNQKTTYLNIYDVIIFILKSKTLCEIKKEFIRKQGSFYYTYIYRDPHYLVNYLSAFIDSSIENIKKNMEPNIPNFNKQICLFKYRSRIKVDAKDCCEIEEIMTGNTELITGTTYLCYNSFIAENNTHLFKFDCNYDWCLPFKNKKMTVKFMEILYGNKTLEQIQNIFDNSYDVKHNLNNLESVKSKNIKHLLYGFYLSEPKKLLPKHVKYTRSYVKQQIQCLLLCLKQKKIRLYKFILLEIIRISCIKLYLN